MTSLPVTSRVNGSGLWIALGLVAAAALVRGAGVGLASFRGDEAFSIRIAQLPIDTLFAAMAASEPNPPLQFLFLRSWIGLVGLSEVAVRWPSVLSGVLTVALTYRFGRVLIGKRATLLATGWVAVQPFLVWYAEDVRAYASLALWLLVAAWAAWQGLAKAQWRWWVLSAIAAWTALALHYFAALTLAALAIAVLTTPTFSARWRQAAATYGSAALIYLPWALYVWPLLSGHAKSWLTPLSADEIIWRTLVAYSTGGRWAGAPEAWLAPGAAGLGLLLAVGVVAKARSRQRLVWLLALGPATPALLGLLNAWRPTYAEHYAIPGLIGSLMLAAAGLHDGLGALNTRQRGLLAAIALTAIAAGSLVCVRNVWLDPAYAKSPDWRGLAATLSARARPGDVVWMNLPDPALEVYLAGRVPFENAPPGAVLSVESMGAAERALAVTAAEAQITRAQQEVKRIFFLAAPSPAWDPEGLAGKGLEACCELIDDRVVSGLRLQIFDTPLGALSARRPLAADFANGVRLTGYRLERLPDRLHLTLFWQATESVTTDYTVFVHLVAADGFQVAGADGDPRDGQAPTSSWTTGIDVIDPHPIVPPDGLTAGAYRLRVGWYLRETGERVARIDGGEFVELPEPVP